MTLTPREGIKQSRERAVVTREASSSAREACSYLSRDVSVQASSTVYLSAGPYCTCTGVSFTHSYSYASRHHDGRRYGLAAGTRGTSTQFAHPPCLRRQENLRGLSQITAEATR